MMMRSYIISGIMDFFFYRNIYESPNIVPLLICMQYKYVGICLQCIFCLFTFRLSNRRAAIDPLHIPVTHTGTVLAHFTQWAKNVKYSEKIEVCSRDCSITSEARRPQVETPKLLLTRHENQHLFEVFFLLSTCWVLR